MRRAARENVGSRSAAGVLRRDDGWGGATADWSAAAWARGGAALQGAIMARRYVLQRWEKAAQPGATCARGVGHSVEVLPRDERVSMVRPVGTSHRAIEVLIQGRQRIPDLGTPFQLVQSAIKGERVGAETATSMAITTVRQFPL